MNFRYMFGFSFGARLVIDASINFGIYRVKEIDGMSDTRNLE